MYDDCYLLGTNRGTISETADTYDESQADALLTMFKIHARITDNSQDAILPTYLRAAVSIVENYTGRDVYTHARAYVAQNLRETFRFKRGIYSGLTIVDNSTPTPLSLVAGLTILGTAGPKAYGFSVDLKGAPYAAIAFTSGFATLLNMPSDMLAFVMQSAGTMYEIRETLVYSSSVQHADKLAFYLLDSWHIPAFA